MKNSIYLNISFNQWPENNLWTREQNSAHNTHTQKSKHKDSFQYIEQI